MNLIFFTSLVYCILCCFASNEPPLNAQHSFRGNLSVVENNSKCKDLTQRFPTSSCENVLDDSSCSKIVKYNLCNDENIRSFCLKDCGCNKKPPTTTTTATTTTTTAATTFETTNSSCLDYDSECKVYGKMGFCKNSAYSIWMNKSCRKTCDLCKKGRTDECKDEQSLCKSWSSRGYCDSYEIYMKVKCKKSCKLCKDNNEITTIATTTETTAVNTSRFLTSTICEDVSSSCFKWFKSGFCDSPKYRILMKKFCKKTCGLCEITETIKVTEPEETIHKHDKTKFSGSCGQPAIELKYKLMQRIYGGTTSTYGSIPWQAALFKSIGAHLCGAVLIDSYNVLTAAHCVEWINNPEKDCFVMLGKNHRIYSKKDFGELKVVVESVISHPRYNRRTFDNDIAILRLKDRVSFTDYIRPVCLPSEYLPLDEGLPVIVSGWGKTEDTNRADLLKQAELKIISNNQCNSWLYAHYKIENEVTDNMVCAGYKQGVQDACQGDSGGPLVTRVQGINVLVGLVSWGYGCAEKTKPGVYTKVQNYLEWISSVSKH